MLDINDIRRRYDLREMIPPGLEFRETDRCRVQRCLWHQEMDPSLLVFQDGYYCKACGVRGDVIDWIRFEKQYDFHKALAYLSQNAGSKIHHIKKIPKLAPLPSYLAMDYHLALTKPTVNYYLSRGLSKETIIKFQLGYGKPPGYQKERFSIPIYDGNDLVNIKFRRDDTCHSCGNFDTLDIHGIIRCPQCKAEWQADGTKYSGIKNRNEPRIYNQNILYKGLDIQSECGILSSVVITEGEFDTMIANQNGYQSVCSTAGSTSFQRAWIPVFTPFREVFSIYDNDEAGNKGRKILHQHLPRVIDIYLPLEKEKSDLTDYFKFHDKTSFDLLLKKAVRRERNQRQLDWLRKTK